MNKIAIVFDLDGTLIDSESFALVGWQRTLAAFGKQFTDEHFPLVLGRQLDETLELVKEIFELEASVPQILAVLGEVWTEITKDGLPAKLGVFELLDELDRRGIPWGVATNSDHAYAVQHLSGIDILDRAHAVIGCDDVANPKPAPDVFLACAAQMGIAFEHCLAIEDSLVGHQAAAASGMTVVVVPEDMAHSAEFTQADHIFPSLDHLRQQLNTFFGPSAT